MTSSPDVGASDPDAAFEAIVGEFVGRPGIRDGEDDPTRRGFGSHALTVEGRIFAMLVRGALVVKLPRQRVEALVATGRASPFDANTGRHKREWAAIPACHRPSWLPLAEGAVRFVGPRA